MKFTDLVYDVVVEEIKTKSTINYLIKKWFGENPTQEQLQLADKLITFFGEKRNGLSPRNPNVLSFLLRHDGNRGHDYFDPNDLNKIEKYSLAQIQDLYDELSYNQHTVDDAEEPDRFRGEVGGTSTPEKIEASAELWKSDKNAIINENGFKAHYIPDEITAVKFGYYVQHIMKLIKNANNYRDVNSHWCVTGRGSSDSWSNRWGYYRESEKRTFYFIYDESKKPNENENWTANNKYFLSALQVVSSTRGYKLTSVLNDGDMDMSWDEVTNIYPQLAEHRDQFVRVGFTDEELQRQSAVSRVNETPGDRWEFAGLPPKLKKQYINQSLPLKKALSWQAMPEFLQNQYIVNTTEASLFDKFQSLEFMEAIKKTPNMYNLLKNQVLSISERSQDDRIRGRDIGCVFEKIMESRYKIARRSIDNKNIALLENKSSALYGLWHFGYNSFVKHNNVVFNDEYKAVDWGYYVDLTNNKEYYVETYSKTDNPNDESFYSFVPRETFECHFIGHMQFNEINKKLIKKEDVDDEDESSYISDFNPVQDVDIKEIEKGL